MKCLDCGGQYEVLMPISLLIPKRQWLAIHPDDGGVLCANCICTRASRLPNVLNLTARITFTTDLTDHYQELTMKLEQPPVDNAHVALGCEQFSPETIALNARSPSSPVATDYYPSHEALCELVSLRAEYDALNGGGPGWSKRWEAALANAIELTRKEP